MVPRVEMESELRSQDKELADTITGLGKKVRLSVTTTTRIASHGYFIDQVFGETAH
jgi:hypothetical protein